MHTGHRQLGYLLAPGTLLLLLPMGMALAGHVGYRMQNYVPDRPKNTAKKHAKLCA